MCKSIGIIKVPVCLMGKAFVLDVAVGSELFLGGNGHSCKFKGVCPAFWTCT